MNKVFYYTTLLVFTGFSVFSCQKSDKKPSRSNSTDTAKSGYTIQKLDTSLEIPWGLVFLPDGRLLITDKKGEILVFKNDKNTGEKLIGVPAVFSNGQGGLMDIKLHPDYAKNKWIYITYSKPVEGGATTAVMRFKLNGNTLVEKQEIYAAKPILKADFHFGSRLVFDKQNHIFVSSGERGTQPKVQELNNDHGKIHRLNDDGTIPKDNPFVNQAGANPSIWSYGHRNPQGLVYDAATDRVWGIEHGPKGGDELNLIEKGKNYGWPKTSYGINYDGSILTPHKEMEGIENPKRYWVPSIAPCGATIVTGNKYPGWKGNLLITALSFKHIARVQLDGTKYVSEEKIGQDLGRFRCVVESPDGFIYAITEGPGQLLKILPGK